MQFLCNKILGLYQRLGADGSQLKGGECVCVCVGGGGVEVKGGHMIHVCC